MGSLPWLQAIENEEGVFSGEWGWDFLKRSQEIRLGGVHVAELLGNALEISHLRIVRVRRPFMALMVKYRASRLCGVEPGGFRF